MDNPTASNQEGVNVGDVFITCGTLLRWEDEYNFKLCQEAAGRLSKVTMWMRENGYYRTMLDDLVHSNFCIIKRCHPMCRMFKRIRRHITYFSTNHTCALKREYCNLRRLHHSVCIGQCGLVYCRIRNNIRAQTATKRRVMTSNRG